MRDVLAGNGLGRSAARTSREIALRWIGRADVEVSQPRAALR